MIKVSIIIPIYGVEKYIEKCARSVFEQTYSNLEIIFVDDCTPDNSINVLRCTLEKYPTMKDKIQILSYPKNKGLAGARKFGLEHASGDYVLQIDSDDYIDIHMVEAMVAEVEKTDADIVICDMNVILPNKQIHIFSNPSLNARECMMQVLKTEVHGSVANKLIKKSLYIDNDICPVEGLNMREDLSVMYRLLYFAKRLAYISQPFYHYIIRNGSVSSARMNRKQQQDAENLIIHMNDFIKDENISDNDILESFNFFKAQIKTDILLFGDVNALSLNLYDKLKLGHFLYHPKISFSHKLMGLFDVLHLKLFVWLYRKVIDFLFNIKMYK